MTYRMHPVMSTTAKSNINAPEMRVERESINLSTKSISLQWMLIQFTHQPLVIVSALAVVTITWSLSIRLSQSIVCIANVHTQFSAGTSVQVIFV